MPQNQNIYFLTEKLSFFPPVRHPSDELKSPFSKTIELDLPFESSDILWLRSTCLLPSSSHWILVAGNIFVGEDPKPTLMIDGPQSPLRKGFRTASFCALKSAGAGTRSTIYKSLPVCTLCRGYLVCLSPALHTTITKYISAAIQCHFCN